MKQSELKARILATIPEATDILIPDGEHGYTVAHVKIGTALKGRDERGEIEWTEDYGEQYTPEAKYGERVPVLIVE